jgi:hypothetical protein
LLLIKKIQINMKKLFTKCFYTLLLCGLFTQNIVAQVTLNADGPGSTYELINGVLAPGYDAVEHAECIHSSFGRHIAEVFDTDLNQNVFEFYIHLTPDNDRCTSSMDRQRVEIKTYDQSPANLKGTIGETVTYKWKFKIPTGFKPSSGFTHIHQIKPVDGDEDNPLFTITLRKGTPNKLEVNHYDATLPNNVLTKLVNVNMSSFENTWVEATQTITVGANGKYSMMIKRVSDNFVLVNYTNNDIVTIRPDNTFIRPKWGIYRSLSAPADLRDDAIRFANFSIQEGVLPIELTHFDAKIKQKSVFLNWKTASEKDNEVFNIEHSTNGKDYQTIGQVKGKGTSDIAHSYSFEHTTPSVSTNYYRLKQVDYNGTSNYSAIKSVIMGKSGLTLQSTLVNDVLGVVTSDETSTPLSIFNTTGQEVFTTKVQGTQQLTISSLPNGLYIVRTTSGDVAQFVKQ